MSIDDQDHNQRALLASRFIERDAAELAAILVREGGLVWSDNAVRALRQSGKHFATLAAQCELAACVMDEAIG